LQHSLAIAHALPAAMQPVPLSPAPVYALQRGTPNGSRTQATNLGRWSPQQSARELEMPHVYVDALKWQTSPSGSHVPPCALGPGVMHTPTLPPLTEFEHTTDPSPRTPEPVAPQQSAFDRHRSPSTRHPRAGWQMLTPVGP
jgi:hypothetical protein